VSNANSGNIVSFFTKREKVLKLAATAYVVSLILFHWQLPSRHVWIIAAIFSIVMNLTYLIEAISVKRTVAMEASVAAVLILASILGLLFSPLILIAAIFGHGCWDLAKHYGAGVQFFSWYIWACFVVDTIYSAALIYYWSHL